MKTVWAVVLTIYLAVLVVFIGWGVYKLWGLNPDFAQVIALPASADQKPVVGQPKLSRIVPDAVAGDGVKINIIGAGFTKSTVVKLDDAARQQTYIDPNHVTISLAAADLKIEGTDVITLSDGKTDFGTGRIEITKAGERKIDLDTQFLLLVLLMGAFGSCVYGLKTLADYLGEGKFEESWCLYYFIQPFEGAGIAWIMYLAIRGGFLTGAGDTNSVNKFGICAIAALAGAFSDTAFMKLREVFLALFKPHDDRSGKIESKLQITTASLPNWDSTNNKYDETLKAGGGSGGFKWQLTKIVPAAVGPLDMPPGLTLDAVSGRISGPKGSQHPGTYTLTFTVTDGKDTVSKDFTLIVT